MRVFDSSLSFYRKTFKRVYPLHVAVHWLATHSLIPWLEKRRHFETMPDDPFWLRLEMLARWYEADTVRQVERLVQPGMTVLDIGAHVGYYARLCSRLVGQAGRVVAFEPHPRVFAVLSRNVERLSNVAPVQTAAAETEGVAELFDYLIMSASSSLHYDASMLAQQKSLLGEGDVAPRIAGGFPVQKYTIRTAPVDVCLAEQGIERVDVVKMDIEGAEIHALRGMKATIARSPGLALVMEYNPPALRAFGFEPEEALAEVLALGFERMEVIKAGGGLADLTHDQAALAAQTAHLDKELGAANLLFR